MDIVLKKEDNNNIKNKASCLIFFVIIDIGDFMNKKVIKEIFSYVIVIVVALLIKEFVFTLIIVNGDSMNPTLKDNDIMFLNKLSYHFNDIERFDIVVCKDVDGYLIKRVIGLPGDVIYCEDGIIYINDEALDEEFGYGITNDFSMIKVREDEYFVMGDNREVSLDSRKLGSFPRKDILGKTNYVLFPFDRFGGKE